MIYTTEVQHMCPVAKGAYHGPAPIPEEGKWVQAKEISDISGFTHGVGWCAPQQGACKLTLNVKEGVIQEALIETIGCSGMTHSAAMASEILIGKTILEALNTAGVKATFFVVATGYNEKYLPLIADAAAAGHQIALHSASHEYSDIYQSSAAYWQDIELLKERISPYVNTASLHYLRFPGGSTNTVSRRYGGRGVMAELKQQCAEKGYAYVDWNVCAEDAVGGKPSAGTIYRNVVHETGEQTQCIVLMHDSATTRTTAEALPDIIRWYTDNGYTFLTVAEALPLG